jgi:hypothetical protein
VGKFSSEVAGDDSGVRWPPLVLRVAISLLLVTCLALVARGIIASWFAETKSIAGFRHAREWDPSNPDYEVQLALLLAANPSSSSDPSEIVRLLQDATRLGPQRADTWASLGGALESAGNISRAEEAYARALELFPRSPEINWEYANLLIRAGEESKAIEPLRQTILSDSSLRAPAFDLAWRAGIPREQILGMIPARQEVLSAYLDFLVRTHRLDAAASAWQRLLASPDLDAAFRYFDALLDGHRVDTLTTVWADLARHDATRIHWQPGNANLIVNGGFEYAILNGGFDWRTPAVEGATVTLDASVVHNGMHSLCVTFDGSRNLDFGHVAQYVPVKPDTSYQFVAYVRSKAITTESGPRLAIYDAFDRRALSLETDNLQGNTDWVAQNLTFRTNAATRLIVVQVVRPPSGKIDNRISGTLRLDDVSLTAIPDHSPQLPELHDSRVSASQ